MHATITAPELRRRSVLSLAGLVTVSVAVGGCKADTDSRPTTSPAPQGSPTADQRSRVLMAYLSRAGWNYDNGGRTCLKVGNGLGTTERDYVTVCRGAAIGAGLAVRGEQINDAQPATESWLRQNGLL